MRRDEIASLNDLSSGAVAVRAVNSKKSLLIPPDLEGLDAWRAELVGEGIPVTAADPNRLRKTRAIGIVF